jgi:hypothetical protein
MTLGIGATNPKKGAVQYTAQRIDGVPFVIPTGAGVTSAPIGSVVTLQENATTGKQLIVLGANAYTDRSENAYTIIGIGFLEAATQVDGSINQTVGSYVSGDNAAMVSDVNAVASVPMMASYNPTVGAAAYVTVDGTLTVTSYQNVAFPGVVFFKTPGQQSSGQLKTGYCFARLSKNMIG